MLHELVESRGFRRLILALILVNAAAIGLETYPSIYERFGWFLTGLDRFILRVFTAEIFLRLAAARPKREFFRDPWQWFDVVVIGAGYLPESDFLTVFRLLRVLRVMRTFTVMPRLQKIVQILFTSLPALGHVLILLGLLFYVYGTAGTFLYGSVAPQHFGTLGRSLLTLFQVMTLEGWTGIMNPILRYEPYCPLYFISFIFAATFFSLNAVIGILMNNLQDLDESKEVDELRAALARIEAKLEALRADPARGKAAAPPSIAPHI